MPWPPRKGELLPRFDEPSGIEEKLRRYSLAFDHKAGGPKAKGFLEMLGIDLATIDYLAGEIRKGIACTPISKVDIDTPEEAFCTVQFLIAGPGRYSRRTASLRTGWVFDSPSSPPRLTTAFLRGRKNR